MTYQDQIKSPLWQKKRLEIMEKDNFTCQICGDKETTLNVHHLHYKQGNLIHEYDDKCLITLCENCHKNEYDWQNMKLKDFCEDLMDYNFTMFEIMSVLSTIHIDKHCGRCNSITNICGDSTGCYTMTELKDLEDRRNGL